MLKNKDNQFVWCFIRCKKGMFLIKELQFKNVYNNVIYIYKCVYYICLLNNKK